MTMNAAGDVLAKSSVILFDRIRPTRVFTEVIILFSVPPPSYQTKVLVLLMQTMNVYRLWKNWGTLVHYLDDKRLEPSRNN